MFQNRGFKVFASTALCAFIGSLIGLQLTPAFWWVGMLIGGLLGYLTYDFNEVVRTVPIALRQARQYAVRIEYREHAERIGDALRRIPIEVGKAVLIVVFSALSVTLLGLIWTVETVALYSAVADQSNLTSNVMSCLSLPGLGLSLALGLVLFVFLGLATEAFRRLDDSEILRYFLYRATPLGIVTLWLPKVLWQMLRWAVMTVWFLFKLIHSDLRLLCGVDAAIGASIGIFAHNPLIGAIAGGLIGVLNFELISKRWLKLVPARR